MKMLKFTRALLLLLMLSSTVLGQDRCCSETQNSLKDFKSDVQVLKGLIEDLGTKLEQQLKCSPSTNDICSPGFTYLPASKSCYKVVFESHNWTSAAQRCEALRGGSHLVAITCAAENYALKTLLALELSKNAGNTACIPRDLARLGNLFWTSGQRLIANNCSSIFVWKIAGGRKLTVPFTNWLAGEPSCSKNEEFCVDMVAARNFLWNDVPCGLKICPVCEYRP